VGLAERDVSVKALVLNSRMYPSAPEQNLNPRISLRAPKNCASHERAVTTALERAVTAQ
jgi:hypothetical protein